jgi:hypothetical protein
VFRSTLKGLNQSIVGLSPLSETTYPTGHDIPLRWNFVKIITLINCLNNFDCNSCLSSNAYLVRKKEKNKRKEKKKTASIRAHPYRLLQRQLSIPSPKPHIIFLGFSTHGPVINRSVHPLRESNEHTQKNVNQTGSICMYVPLLFSEIGSA